MRMILVIVIMSVLVAFLLVRKWQQATGPIVYEIWDETKPLHRIDPTGLEVLREGPFTLYFPPQHKSQAAEVARALSQGWQIVKRRLDLDLGGFGVVLVPLQKEMGGVFTERWGKEPVPQPLVSSMNWQKLSEAPLPTRHSVYVVLPHEAAHRVLRFEGRWLEDGLAEYIGYLVAQELDPEVLQRSLMARQAEVRALLPQATYDLTSDPPAQFIVKENKRIKRFSSVEVAGYGVSLAFWLQIAQRHGEEVIRRFLERSREHRGVQELAQILSELTGEEIWSKLRQMDSLEVLRTLEQAAEVPVQP